MSKPKTTLKDQLIKTIKTNGPITLAHYMAECLGNKNHGYYMVENPFGVDGDFITAPEISQTFGEVIGLMLMDFWMKAPSTEPINLVELGPGQGTLMWDVLRVLSMKPELRSLINVHFVEMSPRLKAMQKEKVPDATWHESLNTIPDGKTWFLANEFFDALPVHQYQKTHDGWVERAIGLAENNNLGLVTIPAGQQIGLMNKQLNETAKQNEIVEVCPAAISIMGDIAAHMKSNGGFALIIDYGYGLHSVGDSLQALKGHKYINILENPGQQDLTTHVNFASLDQIALESDLKSLGPIFQGEYLQALGLKARIDSLKTNADKSQQEVLDKALNRLTGATEMGELFKVLVVVDKNSPIPAPFDPNS